VISDAPGFQPGPENIAVGAGRDKPSSGRFIRGRICAPGGQEDVHKLEVRYGIEAFFAPKEKAMALERQLRNGGIAIVMVANNGKSTLKDIIPKRQNNIQ
jgi:hypothetical protein